MRSSALRRSSEFYARVADSRGLVWLRLANYGKSIADYDAAIKINPKNASSWYLRGIDELRIQKTGDGEADIAQAEALSPTVAGSSCSVAAELHTVTPRSAARMLLLAFTAFAAPAVVSAGSCKLGKIIELPVTMSGMRPVTTVQINDSSAALLVDSGAEFSMMSAPSAASLHLSAYPVTSWLEMRGVAGGAKVNLAKVRSLMVGGQSLHDVEFLVGGSDIGGGVAGLLGQNVLHIADVEYDLADAKISLMQSSDCGDTALAYWAAGTSTPYSVMNILGSEDNRQTPGTRLGQAKQPYLHTVGSAALNGAPVRVVFDSGAPYSILTLSAAARAGIKPEDSGVVRAGSVHGIGGGMVQTYLAPFSSFKIGDEEIRNTRLRFGDIDLSPLHADMLLGADFFLSHRIYVANAQRKLFFTYNGGPVFNLRVAAN